MDGVLVDSEPLWWQAGVAALATVGVVLENDRSNETRGMRTDEALEYWRRKSPWSGKSIRDLANDVNAQVIQIIAERAIPLPGVLDLISLLSRRGISMAVCSSAPGNVIEAVLASLGLADSIKHVVSAHDEPMGKPHPGAYLRCAALLKTDPRHCIAVEDSVWGAIAAKAAQMKVIVVQNGLVPEPEIFDFCDLRLDTLKELDESVFDSLSKF